jgi:hypothetical protein
VPVVVLKSSIPSPSVLFMNNMRTTISHLLNNQFVQAIGVPSSAAGFAAQIVDDAGAKRAIATQELSELAYKCSPADACAPSDTAAAPQFRIAKMIADLTRKNLVQRGGNAKSQGTYRSHYTGAVD